MFNSCCKLLAQEKIKIALFESASAGYLAYRFSLSPYSGDILIGSLVSYDLRVKENTLHISSELIEKYTAESMQVTIEMIKKGKDLLHADLYIACTGLLKKGGSETKEKPVGTFFYSIYYKNQFYNFRRVFKGPPCLKIRQLIYYISQDIEYIILDNKK
ncbi:CinA family protein [Acinetobacter sp. AYS6]|uniref:CinA family protein n=1 Tax=Acinetobacter TaxID=469 RepID=UPI00029C9D13|nr:MULTISPECIES: CinA family protein [Acinetobacter]EKU38380.1 competence/damage-inducible protein CinA [Acinetobacter sp. WC-141]MBM7140302.1 CinA family protein [Acinetobacter sp. 105-3]MCU7696524.1 CinA family protein [Acinetobacter sp. AYS6]